LNKLSEEKVNEIISNLNGNGLQEDLHELLEYKADTAGGLMSTRALVVRTNQTKSDVLTMIKGHYKSYDSIYDIFIVNEKNILLGTCSLKNLLIQNNNIPIKDFMEVKENVISFPPHSPWRVLAKHISEYNTINVPITNKNRNLLGLVSVDDILPWPIN
jgi:magnesium transporter